MLEKLSFLNYLRIGDSETFVSSGIRLLTMMLFGRYLFVEVNFWQTLIFCYRIEKHQPLETFRIMDYSRLEIQKKNTGNRQMASFLLRFKLKKRKLTLLNILIKINTVNANI